ncbi:glycosyltransferase [Engelhardtia mirabilis]|uniref:Undecaprenyl-phosphate 4-deoxy-4-formamido-L-arabinose transferase n=1 Tax=Engelhardtia mirabilis TaxID=2528011 RepID=A0A518BKD8_9BACT|nr:Undecaprenyl-phosphate 4-deoxy-4-formamido-L-arabinose transferase [Planctomycetes bacterium Pla133]QDV01762.1 Undecaprenyl-phosphate 4-deoxy-4-formamido-L-arabinose transferase [Planctomycetes bacterium Pla86]
MNAPQDTTSDDSQVDPAPVLATVHRSHREGYAGPVDVSIVVPVQSPEAEVRDVTRALGTQLDRLGKTWEIIFVFDGVEGMAWEAVQGLHAERGQQIKTILFKNPFGESVCLSAAFERAHGGLILTSPQYVQVDPLELERMLQAIDEGADFVTPWRHPRVDPVLNRLQSGFFNWVIRQIIRGEFHDLNCYFRLIRREVLEEISVYGDMYRFLPVMAFRQGFQVVEVRVRHLTEWGRAGFFGMGVYIRRFLDVLAVMFLAKFTLKPLRFFGTLGGLSALIGGGICTWLAGEKLLLDVSISGRPMLVAGVLLLVLGVQIIGFGLVGEIIIFSQARNLKEYRIERIYE